MMRNKILSGQICKPSFIKENPETEVWEMNVIRIEDTYTIKDIYELPDGERAELIDGKIYYMAPPGMEHQRLVHHFDREIGNYIQGRHGDCEMFPAPFAVFLSDNDRNYVEPDISVICDRNKITEKGCLGAPDWIVEIVSPSNSSHDYIRKLNLYADAGVREYWIVNPMNQSMYVYFLEDDKFRTTAYTLQDKINVNIYDDLWIDFTELGL